MTKSWDQWRSFVLDNHGLKPAISTVAYLETASHSPPWLERLSLQRLGFGSADY